MAASVSPRRRMAARQARPSADLVFPLFGSRPRDSTWNPRRGPFPLLSGSCHDRIFFWRCRIPMVAQEKTKVPAASFSRLSATNVLFGLDKA